LSAEVFKWIINYSDDDFIRDMKIANTYDIFWNGSGVNLEQIPMPKLVFWTEHYWMMMKLER